RRPEQAPAAGGIVAHLGRAEKDRGVHHPQRRRSGLSRRPHHGDDGAARPREEFRTGTARPAAQSHRIAEGAGIRRACASHLVRAARRSAARPRAGKQGRRSRSPHMSTQTIAGNPEQSFSISMRTRERILGIASPILLLVVWEVAARLHFIDTRFFPPPSRVIAGLIGMLRSGELVTNTLVSLRRLALGTLIGGGPALFIGIAMGLNRWVRAALDPLVA